MKVPEKIALTSWIIGILVFFVSTLLFAGGASLSISTIVMGCGLALISLGAVIGAISVVRMIWKL